MEVKHGLRAASLVHCDIQVRDEGERGSGSHRADGLLIHHLETLQLFFDDHDLPESSESSESAVQQQCLAFVEGRRGDVSENSA